MIRAYPGRALLLWIALHVFVGAATEGGVLAFDTSASVALTAIAGVVGFADSRRRGETILLGNLGIPAFTPAALWAGTVMLLEIVLRAVTVARV